MAQFLSSVFSRDPMRSLGTVANTFAEGLVLCFLIQNVVRTPKALRQATWALLAAGAALSTLTCYQYLTGDYSHNFGGFAQRAHEESLAVGPQRVAGPLGDPNRYAQILLMLFPVGFFCCMRERASIKRILAAATSALVLLAMAMTHSRGAALSCLCVLAVMVLLRYIQLYQFAIIVALGGLTLLLTPSFIERLSKLESLSGVMESGTQGIVEADGWSRSRFTEAMAAALIFLDHPLLGVGADMYPLYYQKYARRVEGGTVKQALRRPHTLYLGMAAELGAIGLGVFLATVAHVLRGLARTRRLALASRPDLALLATGYLLALIGYLCTAMFLHFGFVRYFWLMMALGSVVVRIAQPCCAPRNGQAAEGVLHTGGLP